MQGRTDKYQILFIQNIRTRNVTHTSRLYCIVRADKSRRPRRTNRKIDGAKITDRCSVQASFPAELHSFSAPTQSRKKVVSDNPSS